MLRFLSITNFAVIQHLEVDFHSGLNLLTGETGTGKSIIVDALNLLLGGRSSSDMVRTGESTASIEGLFELTGERERRAQALMAVIGIEKDPEEYLTIRREIQANGRGRIFINDKSVTAATLRDLQPSLVEIHGQGEQQVLASGRAHLDLLDGFAGCGGLRREAARNFTRWKAAGEALRALARDVAARRRGADLMRFQLTELEKLDARPREDDELLGERTLLAHAERALELGAGAYAELYESDQSVLTRLATLRRQLQKLNEIDGRVAALLDILETATVALTDVAESLRGYGSGSDFSPARLSEIESRLAELERAKRKYERDLPGLIELREELQGQVNLLGGDAESERELRREFEAAAREYMVVAGRLTASRHAAAPRLEKRVMKELRHVAMERARFIVSIETAPPESSVEQVAAEVSATVPQKSSEASAVNSFWTSRGADRVEFFLAANEGESARPLMRVASGGELSRVMLALRTACRSSALPGEQDVGAGTIVFDEIDAGIGGHVATSVGRRLSRLAATQQILCVTHQPQIACFADHHYAVSKHVANGRTATTVSELDLEQRVGELARMIGGADDIATARETARWLLERVGAARRGVERPVARGGKASKG